MREPLQPLLFDPVYKDYIWGGGRIRERYRRPGAPDVCAESWEVSAHPDGMSRVLNGPFADLSLAGLTARLGAALVGAHVGRPPRFPLLFKLIDARENLSVQVHPADDNAGLVGGEAKTEMWYVLDRTPGAVLYAGLRAGTTPVTFRAAMSQGRAPESLLRMEVNPGEALFIPGGLVHAIGAGCLFYEVQQSSNTTYRLYDWGRLDADGQPRPLHIQQAFQVIRSDLPEARMIRPPPAPEDGANHWTEVRACQHFRLRRLNLRQAETVPLDGSTFHVLFVCEGAASASAGGASVPLPAGTSCLIPAGAGSFVVEPAAAPAVVLVTTLL